MQELLNSAQVAALLRLSPRTIAGWRIRGRGPRFVRFSRRAVRYRETEVAAWVRSQVARVEGQGPAPCAAGIATKLKKEN